MKNLLKLADLSCKQIMEIIDLGDKMKKMLKNGEPHAYLAGKHLAMIFSKSSTRTRVSFEVGFSQLGGKALFLSNQEIQLGRGESIKDTAKVLSRYVDGIMIRTFAQSDVEELAVHADVPIINGLTDYCHPCQILGDLMTIRESKKTLEGLTAAWVGDGSNVCNSLIVGATKCGIKVRVAAPEGFRPHPDAMAAATGDVLITDDPREAVDGADVVFTDVWASMGQEDDTAKRHAALKNYQVNAKLMGYAAKDAIVQHCLPAHKGEEITEDVFDSHEQIIYDEAENRMHVQKAVMYLLMK